MGILPAAYCHCSFPLKTHPPTPTPTPTLQFKKSVFELNVPINPIAIKYNKVFVDGYWNSRNESYAAHLFRIMTSWAMVVDVWFMDPVDRSPGETGADFARRVQRMVAARAGLKAVEWDGYIKYWRPSEKFIKERQAALADELCGALGIHEGPNWEAAQAQARHSPFASGTASSGGTRHTSMSENEGVAAAAAAAVEGVGAVSAAAAAAVFKKDEHNQ